VTGLSSQLQNCNSLTAEVRVIATRAQMTTITSTEYDRLELLRDSLSYLSYTLYDFDSMLDKAAANSTHKWHYFPDRLFKGDCNSVFQSVNTSISYQISWLDSFIPDAYSSPTVSAGVFTNMTNLRTHMSRLSECLLAYKKVLDDFETRLHSFSQATFRTGLSYEPPVATLSTFQRGGQWIDDLYLSYVGNLLSKKDMAKMFADKGYSMVVWPASKLYSDMEISLFTKLSDFIDEQETLMVSFYSSLLDGFADIQRHLFANDTELELFARRFPIWRMPIANFQMHGVLLFIYIFISPQVVDNRREKRENRKLN